MNITVLPFISAYGVHHHATTPRLPVTGCGVVAFVGPLVYIDVDVCITTELTSALQTVVVLAVCTAVDTEDK
jgi:hypothetical protein